MPVWRSVSQSTKIGDKIGDFFVVGLQEQDCISDLISHHYAVQHNDDWGNKPPIFEKRHSKDPRPPVRVDGPVEVPTIKKIMYARLSSAQLSFQF